jgi:hypothetical protein
MATPYTPKTAIENIEVNNPSTKATEPTWRTIFMATPYTPKTAIDFL